MKRVRSPESLQPDRKGKCARVDSEERYSTENFVLLQRFMGRWMAVLELIYSAHFLAHGQTSPMRVFFHRMGTDGMVGKISRPEDVAENAFEISVGPPGPTAKSIESCVAVNWSLSGSAHIAFEPRQARDFWSRYPVREVFFIILDDTTRGCLVFLSQLCWNVNLIYDLLHGRRPNGLDDHTSNYLRKCVNSLSTSGNAPYDSIAFPPFVRERFKNPSTAKLLAEHPHYSMFCSANIPQKHPYFRMDEENVITCVARSI